MPLKKVIPRSVTDQVVASLRAALVRGEYAPSTRLVEGDIAEQLGVSRIPVREALATLVAEGLLVRGKKGVHVPELAAGEIEQIYLARDALESPLYERAASRLTDTDIVRLRRLQAQVTLAAARGALDELAAANRAFHFVILERSGFGLLVEMIDRLWDRTSYYRAFFWLDEDHRGQTVAEHEQIIEACVLRDASALVVLHEEHRHRLLRHHYSWMGSN